MDFSPRTQRLIAEIKAVQLKADCSATQLAADVRQILLAATVDIEQRWQFLTPEDQVDALTDLITLTLVYNRAFGDEVSPTEVLTQAVGKTLSEQSSPVDQATLATGLQADDVATAVDVYARVVDYARSPEHGVEMIDAIETLLTLIRDYADTAAISDVAAKAPEKVFDDLGGRYVEVGYFADDYWQAEGPSPYDVFAYAADYMLTDTAALTDLLASAMSYARAYADSTLLADATSLEPQLTRTESLVTADDATKSLALAYEESLSATDVAALDFVTQIQELVSAAEDFARTVDFVRATAEAATATDAFAKTFATAFSDVGGLYAVLGYFADDYVVAPTGPTVYDTFSYTLA